MLKSFLEAKGAVKMTSIFRSTTFPSTSTTSPKVPSASTSSTIKENSTIITKPNHSSIKVTVKRSIEVIDLMDSDNEVTESQPTPYLHP
ncbi:hypothetical protein EON65_59235, partial [archaeon]